jgi:hypothetical protein
MSWFGPKRLLPAIGTLALAILGSALWEAVRTPLSWASSILLNLVTFGIDSLRDSIYRDAAAQVPERAGTTILSMSLGMLSGVVTGLLGTRFLINRAFGFKDSTREISGDNALRRLNRSERIAKQGFWVLLPLLVTIVILGNREIYVVRASAYMNQLQQIASPFITDQQSKIIRSSFAQVQTRIDFVKLVDTLLLVIKNNGANAPKFSIF